MWCVHEIESMALLIYRLPGPYRGSPRDRTQPLYSPLSVISCEDGVHMKKKARNYHYTTYPRPYRGSQRDRTPLYPPLSVISCEGCVHEIESKTLSIYHLPGLQGLALHLITIPVNNQQMSLCLENIFL